MIEKINELKNNSKSKEVTSLCEAAIATISSAIYNGVTPEAKLEIERVALTNLFEGLSKHEDVEGTKEWKETQERLYAVRNLGVREAVNSLNENAEVKNITDSFRDILNEGVPEVLLYEQFTTALQSFNYFPEVGNAIKAVQDRVSSYQTDVDITKIVETMKQTRSNYLVPLIEDAVNNYLANKNAQTKSFLKETLIKFTYDPFVRDLVSIVTLDATELQLEHANAECDIEKVYSPVLFLQENEAVFGINRVYYVKKGNNISRLPNVDVLKLDEEFKALCETLSNPNVIVDKKGITVYYGNDKAFISEDSLVVNEKEMKGEDLKNLLEVSGMVGNKEFFMLVEFLQRNFEEIAEVDFVKRVYLKEDMDYSADVFKLRDNVFITTHDPLNAKSTFYRNVNPMQAKNIMMEHMRFDVTSIFEGLLPDEEKINAQIDETKAAYNTYISDLQMKIDKFQNATYGEGINEQVVAALEQELQEVKGEYKDYLNHIEKYMRAPGLDEEISIDINVDGKKYTVPIPQEKAPVDGEADGVEAGTEVGREDIVDEPASAVTFDDEDTELLGDTPSIPDDMIDIGVKGAEEDAEEAEEEAEDDAEAEAEAGEEEDELKQDTEEEGDEIKVEDEVDIEDFEGEDDEDEEEINIEKKKKEKLESAEPERKLKKKTFIREAGEEEKHTKKKVFLKKKVHESVKVKKKSKLNEESTWNGGIQNLTKQQSGAQIGDTVMYDKKKGYVIGAIGNDLIVQVQGSSHMAAPSEVRVLGAKVETLKPPFKFSKETQKLLFEQYVKCGIFMGSAAVKTNDCYVVYGDWQKAVNEEQISVIVEGQQVLLPKAQIRIFEDVNTFANLDNYIPGVIIDEATGEVVENVQLNVVDYTEAIGDADPVRIIRGGEGIEPGTDSLPKSVLRVAEV